MIMVEVEVNVSFFISANIEDFVGSSLCGDGAHMGKIYSTYIYQYPILSVQGLIKIPKSTNSSMTQPYRHASTSPYDNQSRPFV